MSVQLPFTIPSSIKLGSYLRKNSPLVYYDTELNAAQRNPAELGTSYTLEDQEGRFRSAAASENFRSWFQRAEYDEVYMVVGFHITENAPASVAQVQYRMVKSEWLSSRSFPSPQLSATCWQWPSDSCRCLNSTRCMHGGSSDNGIGDIVEVSLEKSLPMFSGGS